MKSAAALLVAALLALAGCNSGGRPQNSTDLRVFHAVVDAEPLDALVEGDLKFPAVPLNESTTYANFNAGTRNFKVLSSTTKEVLLDQDLALASSLRSTAVLFGSRSAMRVIAVGEDTIPAPSGRARVRVVNVASGSPNVDVYLTTTNLAGAGTAVVAGALFGIVTGTGEVAGGDYKVIVTAAGTQDILFQSPTALPFGGGNGVTVVVSPTAGALLVNVALLQQGQTGVVNFSGNASSRYRFTNAMADATVNLKVDNVQTVEGAAPFASSGYLAAAAGARALRTEASNVPGTALATINSTFAVGADYTVLAAGTRAAPSIVRLADDNRLPATGNARLRVANLLTDGTSIEAAIDGTVRAATVAPNTASAYAEITATIVAVLEVRTAGGAVTLATVSPAEFAADRVVTVYVFGNSLAPQVKIVTDR